MLDPNNLTDRKLLEEARKQQEKFRSDPAPTSPRQPVSAERLTKDNVLRHWRTCEDGITCMEPATGRNREHADWVKFSDFAQVVDERDEAYRSAPATPIITVRQFGDLPNQILRVRCLKCERDFTEEEYMKHCPHAASSHNTTGGK